MTRIIKQFTPNWFTVTMGTGIVSLMLGQLSRYAPPLQTIAAALWLANIVLFIIFAVLFAARALTFAGTMPALLRHSDQSMFLGAIPMGLATVVNGFAAFGPAFFGVAAYALALRLWEIDAVLAVASGLLVPILMSTIQRHSLESMSALWLLPIVPAEVAAASAGVLAPHLAQPEQQFLLVAGTVLWAFSVLPALSVLGILFLRLAVHGIPPKELGLSGWLALGPLGTGSQAAVLLGGVAHDALAGTNLSALAAGADAIAILAGLTLWAYGVWWWVFGATASLVHLVNDLPFNLGWWALTFPLGVFTASTYALAAALASHVFATIAVALSLVLVAFWLIVVVRTVRSLQTPVFLPSRTFGL